MVVVCSVQVDRGRSFQSRRSSQECIYIFPQTHRLLTKIQKVIPVRSCFVFVKPAESLCNGIPGSWCCWLMRGRKHEHANRQIATLLSVDPDLENRNLRYRIEEEKNTSGIPWNYYPDPCLCCVLAVWTRIRRDSMWNCSTPNWGRDRSALERDDALFGFG